MFETLKKPKAKRTPFVKISQGTIAQDKTGRWRCSVARYYGFNKDKDIAGLMVQMKYRN